MEIARALATRFEEVGSAELRRLRRKTSSLTPALRAEVDWIACEVLRGIASRVEPALASDAGDLAEVLRGLFDIGPNDMANA
jgi:hypothetical protein